jgi:hypothetical protein
MAEIPNSGEYKAAQAERLGKLNEGVRQLTRGLLKESFGADPIKPEDHILAFRMAMTDKGKVGIFISKPSKDEARGGDEGEENKVNIFVGSIEKNHTPFRERLSLADLSYNMEIGPQLRMLRNLHSTIYTDKFISTQYSLEDLASEQPVTPNREGIQDLTPEQLDVRENILNSFGGNTSGGGFRLIAQYRR